MTDLYRNADDPLGVAFDVMVPCPECGGSRVIHLHPRLGFAVRCPACNGSGTIPNPDITQECGTCGGSGKGSLSGREQDWLVCGDCEGRGWTFRKTVRVAERVKVMSTHERDVPSGTVLAVNDGVVRLWANSTWRDITHLWPEEPCRKCRGSGERIMVRNVWGGGRTKRPCPECNGKGTIRTFPKPGELWEIGWREAELVEVVDDCDDLPDTPALIETLGPTLRYWPEGAIDLDEWQDITHHFPTPPKPGQRAGVLGDLVLADKAVRCDD